MFTKTLLAAAVTVASFAFAPSADAGYGGFARQRGIVYRSPVVYRSANFYRSPNYYRPNVYRTPFNSGFRGNGIGYNSFYRSGFSGYRGFGVGYPSSRFGYGYRYGRGF